MNFVFTGTFHIDGEHIVRDLLVQMAQDRGWYVQKSIDYYTDYLVQSPKGGVKTVKHRKAIELGVKIITPEEFWEMAKSA